jgi:polyhydroxybutyrate depolymerase
MEVPMRLTILLILAILNATSAAAERVDLGGRFYRIDLPATVADAPILIALHGGGGNPDQFARASGLAKAAQAAGYAVILPAGSGRGRLLTWNAGYCCAAAAQAGIDDLAFLDAVIADARARFGLSDDRLFLTGMSNGSMLAETYAALRADRVTAVAGVAGTPDVAHLHPRFAVPLLHIHGTADDHVPYTGGVGPSGLTNTDFAAVADLISTFLAPFGGGLVRSERIIDPADDGMRVVEETWSKNGRPALRLLTVEGGGHHWPGGPRAGRRGGTRDISANAEILRFFESFR